MYSHTHNPSRALVGSIAQVAKATGQSEADAMLMASTVVAVDTSGSMGSMDAGHDRTEERYEVACNELEKLQAARPGEIVVMSWSGDAVWDLHGTPTNQGGGTNILAPIDEFLARGLDGLLNLTIIADGDVHDSQKGEAIKKVAKMQSRVDTIFIGDPKSEDGKAGAAFLAKLARAGRGKHATTIEPGTLAAPMMRMLPPPDPNTKSSTAPIIL